MNPDDRQEFAKRFRALIEAGVEGDMRAFQAMLRKFQQDRERQQPKEQGQD